MFCKYCGKEINDDAYVCIHCGRLLESQPVKQGPAEYSSAKVFAALGLVFSFLGLLAILGLAFSLYSISKYNTQKDQSGRGCAVAGVAVSIVEISFLFLILIIGLSMV